MQPLNILLHDNRTQRWLHFSNPAAVTEARALNEVLPTLEETDRLVHERGLWAVGFVGYEAGPAFDPAMTTHAAGALPLVWFALFEHPEILPAPPASPPAALDWRPGLGRTAYEQAIRKIKKHIARGDTYQVNFTLRMHADAPAETTSLFNAMANGQRCGYAAVIETSEFSICSASPELFFDLTGNVLTSKPMKGTAGRGLSNQEDQYNAEWLRASEKNRAENLMIVDMVRNDMGRIAQTGSVHVPHLFEIERYPSVMQMTSTVTCETDASIPEIFRALFPCASITGAPKIRTMEIIRDLEGSPRGVYTGAIGFWNSGRRAQFNVAIRTAVIESRTGQATYGTGSGIVWDSGIEDEYDECILKTRVLSTPPQPEFDLLESLRWSPDEGFLLLERHLDRIRASARYFNYPFNETLFRTQLQQASLNWKTDQKVRILVGPHGTIRTEAAVISGQETTLFPPAFGSIEPLSATLSVDPINPQDVFLYHKTTHRQVYETAHASRPGCAQVLLWNKAGELTEFTTANLVLRFEGVLVTPPVEAGLLPGTFREELLALGLVQEQVLTVSDLETAQEIWAVNSVRGWQAVQLIKTAVLTSG